MKLLLLLLLSCPVFSQSSDRWKGLIIDESTPENAIAILGKPNADKTDSFRVYKIEDWFTKSIREKKWRRLEYKNVEGFDKVILAFDTKLVFIELNPKKLDPDILENAYGVPFTATFNKFERALTPGNVGRETGRVQSYPVFYYLYAKAPKTILLAGGPVPGLTMTSATTPTLDCRPCRLHIKKNMTAGVAQMDGRPPSPRPTARCPDARAHPPRRQVWKSPSIVVFNKVDAADPGVPRPSARPRAPHQEQLP